MTPREQVVAEARRWIGTPYHHHGRIRGAGVDCAQILCAVYEACGQVEHVDPGNYPADWHLHRSEELYLSWLEKVGAFEVDRAQPGDVVVFQFGRTWSHGGIVIEPGVVLHAYIRRGVILSRFDEEPLCGRPPRFFSLKGLT